MPISVVVGGQYGSEGKGKIAHWLARRQSAKYAVRVGGPNSGHTAISDNKAFALRQLPTPSLWGNVISVIPSGSYIDVDVLEREIRALNIAKGDLLIHPNAVLIDGWMRKEEVDLNLTGRISSTGQGVGAAVAHRAFRNTEVRFANEHPALAEFLEDDLNSILAKDLQRGNRVIVEGTQGFGLSILHGEHYPFATSRDTSAAGALSEAGLSPLDVDCVVLVIRSYPIRVAGNSGPLRNETTWEAVTQYSGAEKELIEKTTVTGKIRRIAAFDAADVRRAIAVNNPTHICLNHADYLDFDIHEQKRLSSKVLKRIADIEKQISRQIDLVGTGPSTTFEACSADGVRATAA